MIFPGPRNRPPPAIDGPSSYRPLQEVPVYRPSASRTCPSGRPPLRDAEVDTRAGGLHKAEQDRAICLDSSASDWVSAAMKWSAGTIRSGSRTFCSVLSATDSRFGRGPAYSFGHSASAAASRVIADRAGRQDFEQVPRLARLPGHQPDRCPDRETGEPTECRDRELAGCSAAARRARRPSSGWTPRRTAPAEDRPRARSRLGMRRASTPRAGSRSGRRPGATA